MLSHSQAVPRSVCVSQLMGKKSRIVRAPPREPRRRPIGHRPPLGPQPRCLEGLRIGLHLRRERRAHGQGSHRRHRRCSQQLQSGL